LLLKNRRAGANRVIGLNGATRELPTWPVANRSVFYIDGRYYTRLPVGEYELVVGKGPEYRIVKQRVVVAADQTNAVKIKVHRWRDMAAQGWYSGDTHIHYPRASEYDDYILQKLIRAEDLKVANILTYGNGVNIYLSPYSWRPDPLDTDNAPYVLVAGQEDPRTSLLGHSVELNIREPVRDPARYLLYDSVFASIRAQGGLVGYAHAVGRPDVDWYLDPKGLAIDVPAGLVDFVEIMAPGITGTSIWFDFLNLGYKLAPTAGTDSPYASVLGAVRSYVQLNTSFSRDAWFEALRQGRTFASSGPMLEFSVNGNGIGSQLQAHAGEVLVIDAKASINPDIGTLASLELIEQGAVVRKVTSRGGELAMELRHKVSAKHGTWLVLRAQGKNPALNAISAPIYVLVDGQSFWKPSAVPAIVAGLKSKMQEALKPNQTEPNWECESPWPTAANNWNEQMSALEKRISKATALYDALARSAKTAVARH
jgi:hypothetical protein